MSRDALASRYASALFRFIEPLSDSERLEVEAEFRLINGIVKEQEELFRFITSPVIPLSNKEDLLLKIFETIDPKEQVRTFLLLLLRKGRIVLIHEIYRIFHELIEAYSGSAVCKIETAYDLDDVTQKKLIKILEKKTGKKISLHVTTDESTLGGLIASVQEKVYDFSVRARLKALRKQLMSI